jgi:3-phosphoshikimate 1-carboxyvinyltransferase
MSPAVSARPDGRGRPLRGIVSVPGDKSISHRALMLAAMGGGRSRITGLNRGADVAATRRVVEALGARSQKAAGNSEVEVEGCGPAGLREPEEILDAGNSGTTLRLGLGLCAGVNGASVLTGDASLRRRPMRRAVDPLRRMGAVIDGRGEGDLAPLFVRGGALEGIALEVEAPSAQVKSAVLLAGLGARGTTSVTEPVPTRDHTERMLAALGVEVRRSGTTVALEGGAELPAGDHRVPGDLSAAMFLLVAACLVEGSELEVAGVGLNPTRGRALDVLRSMGAGIEARVEGSRGGEPYGTVGVTAGALRGVLIGPETVPAVIDEIPALAIAAARAEGRTEVRGAAELRVKESDRLAALAAGLKGIGADVEELPDGLAIIGPASFTGGEVDSFGDHRIAMAFAIAGLVAAGPVRVRGWDCVNTSFPEFLDVLATAQRRP